MANLKGEFEVRLDDKNRLRLPSGLLRQLDQEIRLGLVISRGFNTCLLLHTKDAWENLTAKLKRLNLFNMDNRDYVRFFIHGATDVELDSSSRILLPRNLLQSAQIKQDIIVYAFLDQIEIWDKNLYEQMMTREPANFANYTDEIFRHKDV